MKEDNILIKCWLFMEKFHTLLRITWCIDLGNQEMKQIKVIKIIETVNFNE